ncbi:HAD family hydrolase [Alkalicoccobacillus gibsonii]|uniref:HAD family hydrolase n=1 Tax=Alkalicoccobacillus gibsonii TaxID=79881 RepID=UPI003F7C3687
MMRNTILFDLDQTLLDKHQTLLHFAARQYKLFKLSTYVEDRELFITEFTRLHQIVMPKKEVYQKIRLQFSLQHALMEAMLEDLNHQFPKESVAFPGLTRMLNELKQKHFKIGIITNGRDFYQRNKIDSLGITSYMDVIVTSGELGIKKPDPAIFLYGLGKLEVQPEQAIFVGDDLTKDIVPAKSLGMRTILMGSHQVNPDIDTNCVHLDEVVKAVEQLRY